MTGLAPAAPAFQNPPSANPDFIAPGRSRDHSPQSHNHHSVCRMMRDTATQRGRSPLKKPQLIRADLWDKGPCPLPQYPITHPQCLFPPRSPLRSPRLGVSIWQKTEDLNIEEARSETAYSSAVQNMERDAPWTAWIRMIQPQEEAAAYCNSLGLKRSALFFVCTQTEYHHLQSLLCWEPSTWL